MNKAAVYCVIVIVRLSNEPDDHHVLRVKHLSVTHKLIFKCAYLTDSQRF